MAPLSPVSRSQAYWPYSFNSRDGIAANFARSLAEAAPPVRRTSTTTSGNQDDIHNRLAGLNSKARAQTIDTIANSNLDPYSKNYWFGVLFRGYERSKERAQEIAASTIALVRAMPGTLAELSQKLNLPSLNPKTYLGDLDWDSFKQVVIGIADTVADKFHISRPRNIYATFNPYSREVAHYAPGSDSAVFNLALIPDVGTLGKVMGHEWRHKEQVEKASNSNDGDAAMLRANLSHYFRGADNYDDYRYGNPVEREAFDTGDIISGNMVG